MLFFALLAGSDALSKFLEVAHGQELRDWERRGFK